ncbi:hypothetical protein BDQ17DRAFT_1357134, partial [Cyathus striatus]
MHPPSRESVRGPHLPYFKGPNVPGQCCNVNVSTRPQSLPPLLRPYHPSIQLPIEAETFVHSFLYSDERGSDRGVAIDFHFEKTWKVNLAFASYQAATLPLFRHLTEPHQLLPSSYHPRTSTPSPYIRPPIAHPYTYPRPIIPFATSAVLLALARPPLCSQVRPFRISPTHSCQSAHPNPSLGNVSLANTHERAVAHALPSDGVLYTYYPPAPLPLPSRTPTQKEVEGWD